MPSISRQSWRGRFKYDMNVNGYIQLISNFISWASARPPLTAGSLAGWLSAGCWPLADCWLVTLIAWIPGLSGHAEGEARWLPVGVWGNRYCWQCCSAHAKHLARLRWGHEGYRAVKKDNSGAECCLNTCSKALHDTVVVHREPAGNTHSHNTPTQ